MWFASLQTSNLHKSNCDGDKNPAKLLVMEAKQSNSVCHLQSAGFYVICVVNLPLNHTLIT